MNTMTQDILREQQLAELALAIKHHDHHYNMSDDFRVYNSGRINKEAILNLLQETFDKKSEQLEFWNEHAPNGCGYTKTYINELKAEGN
mgnify:FL=1